MRSRTKFVNLKRTFHKLSVSSDQESSVRMFYAGGGNLTWEQLLEEHRVVILSEAGSGKTEEIRNVARRLRDEGQCAFFLRIEHVTHDFESAFEEGTFAEFSAWLLSDEPAWILLDSVDEARLRDPADFERAIKKISREVTVALQRVHILITGRSSAWRPKTDLDLCENYLRYEAKVELNDEGEEERKPSADEAEKEAGAFKIVALNDLDASQIESFAKAKGIADPSNFLDAIERADAWSFAARPLDLEELVDFWATQNRIGTRLELIQNSIDQRLKERDENRAQLKPLTAERAYEGAMLIAAASTLTHEPTIQVPDGSHNSQGLSVKALLTDWDDVQCVTLLSRPIFDEAIYGTVRFHHRSVREYLTARWFASLLYKHTSRRNIEQIFFREQYGQQVVVPTTRPILPWLAIFDEQIRATICKIAPEILFEGGDPSGLPLEIRRQTLADACEQLAQGESRRSMAEIGAIQRFANADLTADIKTLIEKYQQHDEVIWVLIRMVWIGKLVDALPETKAVATSSEHRVTSRRAAIKAVFDMGTAKDIDEVKSSLLESPHAISRDLLGEVISALPGTKENIEWLFLCLANAEDFERYHIDNLDDAISAFVERCDPHNLHLIVTNGAALAQEEPVIERRHCNISSKNAWLLKPLASAVERLVESRNSLALSAPCLSVLRMIPKLHEYDVAEFRSEKLQLKNLVGAWPDLNMALFWHSVEEERAWRSRDKEGALTDWWAAVGWGTFVTIENLDFQSIVDHIASRPLLDDKLVALSLAFRFYVDAGRPAQFRNRLKQVAANDTALTQRLNEFLHPPKLSPEMKRFKQQEANWKRSAELRRLKEERNRAEWKAVLSQNVATIRDAGFPEPDAISQWQWYLHERMDEVLTPQTRTNRSHGDWRILENEFGKDVAQAFRDATTAFWRKNSPKLLSEGSNISSIPVSTIFGLTGLSIEARETKDWPSELTEQNAESAFRFAMYELNGFPPWFPQLFRSFPSLIHRVILQEINYELANEEKNRYYLLHDVCGPGEWLWDSLASDLCEAISKNEPTLLQNLGYVLDILQGSSVITDQQLAELAKAKVGAASDKDHLAYWFAVWTGVAPQEAIPALREYIGNLATEEEQAGAAMAYVIQLGGGRRTRSSRVREAYRTPEYLKSLYLLMHEYIKRDKDIDRAGKGVYSPSLRDDAQDARDRLFELLKEFPGKEAFIALTDIAASHPYEAARPWFRLHAKNKAEADAENPPWSLAQVREFADKLESTPSCHRELFDLAVLRMKDLKDDLENGDSSIASILSSVGEETEVRKYIGGWCRECANGRYGIPQEEELADGKKPDFRWLGIGFDAPVPMELKLADNWSGPDLFERLENQLCGDYLRDNRSRRGVFVLVYRGAKKSWQLNGRKETVGFSDLISALQQHWHDISQNFSQIDAIVVIGIDLTVRSK